MIQLWPNDPITCNSYNDLVCGLTGTIYKRCLLTTSKLSGLNMIYDIDDTLHTRAHEYFLCSTANSQLSGANEIGAVGSSSY